MSERLPNLTYHPSNTILHSLRALCAMRVDIFQGMPVRDAAEMRAAVYQCDAAALVTAWCAIAELRLEEIEGAPAPRGWDCVEGDDEQLVEPDWVGLVEGWRKPQRAKPDIVEFPDGAPTAGQLVSFLSAVTPDTPVTVMLGDDEHPILSITNEYTCIAIRVCQ